jgi:hypothetical protein
MSKSPADEIEEIERLLRSCVSFLRYSRNQGYPETLTIVAASIAAQTGASLTALSDRLCEENPGLREKIAKPKDGNSALWAKVRARLWVPKDAGSA